MAAGQLPDDGELRLGSVVLLGRQVRADEGDGPVIAWVTRGPLPEAGQIWWELSALAAQTGLQPVLSPEGAEMFMRPWDVAELDEIDGGAVLAQMWDEKASDDGDEQSAAWVNAMCDPFTRRFPGLAAPGSQQRTAAELAAVLDAVPPAYVCLAAASRPGDFVTAVGWATTEVWWNTPLPLSAVLRSWEDRFGARLLQVGPGAEIRLLVSRPPRPGAESLSAAAELWALGHAAWGGYDYTSQNEATTVADVARTVVGQPIWGFWWD